MSRLVRLCGVMCLGALASCNDGPKRVDLCDLAKAPAAYFDKQIKVEGRLAGDMVALTDKNCSDVSIRIAGGKEFPSMQRYNDAVTEAREKKHALDVDLVATAMRYPIDEKIVILGIVDVVDIEAVAESE